jgi:HEAT repeat protein
MIRFFQNLHIDRASFWIGFLTATLFWWLLMQFRPSLTRLWKKLLARISAMREGRRATTEFHHRNDTIRYAQSLHIAAPLFSLDEILIPPSLLAPPAPIEPGEAPPTTDITDLVLPYMPDWPYLAATYRAPSLTLESALENGANLLILGETGCGKTVSLAYIATQVARHESTEELNQRIPLLIHAAHLIDLPQLDTESFLQPVINAAKQNAGKYTKDRLSDFLHTSFGTGRILLLLDGLDEFPPEQIDTISEYVSTLLDEYPGTQMVATASWDYIDGFTRLGFYPVSLLPWVGSQREDLIARWSEGWDKYIEAQYAEDRERVDPLLMNAWLRDDERPLTPLELTLKVWAAYTGDLIGPSALDAIESYFLRMTADIPDARSALSQVASQMVLSRSGIILGDKMNTESTLQVSEDQEPDDLIPSQEEEQEEWSLHWPANTENQIAGEVSVRRILPDLEAAGVIQKHTDGIYGFIHPALVGYLAAGSPNILDNLINLQGQADWSGKTQTLAVMSAQMDVSSIVEKTLNQDADPVHWELFSVARWMRYAEKKVIWHNSVLRNLASILQTGNAPMGLSGRAIAALSVTAAISGADVLLRKLLDSTDSMLRQLAILGCGHVRDTKAVTKIQALLKDPQPNVRRAACLALVAIGDRLALEAVAETLLSGDEETRRAAAEAFANHPEEGHPTLQDAMGMDDLLVRRAAVFGLQRTAQSWSVELLERIQVEDEQWMVKDAADLSLQILSAPNPHVPKPKPPLTETPWLIAFAGELGMGVSPGKSSEELLFRALREGNEEQKLAALEAIWFLASESSVLPVYHQLFSDQGDVREMSYLTLCVLRACGVELPQPAQFGLGTPQ